MKPLMYKIVCSDIRITELKLKRIKLSKQHLLHKKPNRLNKNKLINWQNKIKELEIEEKTILIELENAYEELVELLK